MLPDPPDAEQFAGPFDLSPVMGRANRALARFANRIALSFARTLKVEAFAAKTTLTGNPVRDRVVSVATSPGS